MDKDNRNGIIVGIISTVVGGIILMVIEPTRNKLLLFFKFILNTLAQLFLSFWRYLTSSHLVNGFLIIVLFGLSITFMVLLIISFFQNRNSGIKENYTKDTFYGVAWKWLWNDSEIYNLWCYCKNCDFALSYDDSSTDRYSHDPNPRIDLICEHCGKVVSSVPRFSKDYLLDVIKREIHRSMRIKEAEQNK